MIKVHPNATLLPYGTSLAARWQFDTLATLTGGKPLKVGLISDKLYANTSCVIMYGHIIINRLMVTDRMKTILQAFNRVNRESDQRPLSMQLVYTNIPCEIHPHS
jgi:hypothetical protein